MAEAAPSLAPGPALLQALQRDVNLLAASATSPDVNPLPSLKKLKDALFGRSKPPIEAIQYIYNNAITPLVGVLSNSRDSCREHAIDLIRDLVTVVPDLSAGLPFIIPTLAIRMGHMPVLESCEEVRQKSIALITKLVVAVGTPLAAYIEDIVNILCRAFADPFAEVRKDACTCVVELCKIAPQAVGRHNTTLVKAMLPSTTHAHLAVRRAVVLALGPVVAAGSNTVLDEMTSALQALAVDSRPSVQEALVQVVGEWLLTLVDRVSYQAKLVQLLLTALSCSDVPAVRERVLAALEAAGLQYERDHEERLRDLTNYGYVLGEPVGPPLPPPYSVRPRLGTRLLVTDCVSKIVPAALAEMSNWTLATRKQGALLLEAVMVHAEANVTSQLANILHTLVAAVGDDDATFRQKVLDCAFLVGRFLPTRDSLPLLLGPLAAPASTPTQRTHHLRVLRAVLAGARSVGLTAEQVSELSAVLAAPEIAQAEHTELQREALRAVSAVVATAAAGSVAHEAERLLLVVLQLRATGREAVADDAHEALRQLAAALRLDSAAELFRAHFSSLLATAAAGAERWTKHSPRRFLLDALVREAAPAVLAEHVPALVQTVRQATAPALDVDVRLDVLRLLLYLAQQPECVPALRAECEPTWRTVLLPCIIWRAGRAAAAVRAEAVLCLRALVERGAAEPDVFLAMLPELQAPLISCLDDDAQPTRLNTAHALVPLLEALGSRLPEDACFALYPELLRRLDDSSDAVRIVAARALALVLDALPRAPGRHAGVVEAVARAALVHADDPSVDIQTAVMAPLRSAAALRAATVRACVREAHGRHGSAMRCRCDEVQAMCDAEEPAQMAQETE